MGSRTNSLAVRVCLILPVSQTAAHPTCRDTRCYPAAGAVDLGGWRAGKARPWVRIAKRRGCSIGNRGLESRVTRRNPLEAQRAGKGWSCRVTLCFWAPSQGSYSHLQEGSHLASVLFFFRLALFSTGQFTGTLEKDGGDDKEVCDIHMLPKQVAAQFTQGT